ncbi:hypothetical protein OIU78_004468 [Salix suchowensis]|nr:hypothetical protein OIU78_004468 [Salix suchowensis]
MLSRIWIVLPIHNVKTHKKLILSLSIALFFSVTLQYCCLWMTSMLS